jgi:thymidylate synthase ThyX
MIKVELIDWKIRKPLEMASHAALTCYQAEMPEMGKVIDVKGRLFDVGHHTTCQHTDFTFFIEGIAVGDITFGLHLASPFYNTDQRSGRYCAKMFLEPDYAEIESYIRQYWSDLGEDVIKRVSQYVKKGVDFYHSNIGKATEIAKKFVKEERPFISEKNLEASAPKIAQEQMRMFIPVIFPTALDFTVNTTALAALWESAWTPSMRVVTDEMKNCVLEKFPEIAFMFDEKRKRTDDFSLQIPDKAEVKYKSSLKLLSIDGDDKFAKPDPKIMHPIDKLHFTPEMMNNSVGDIKTSIEISTATMGQDQRHRTIRRGIPEFTGSFYLPPILRELKFEKEAVNYLDEWIDISKNIPGTLSMILAPYGAMVSYEKRGSFNAVAHEQAKRLCWCAQEEIYHAGKLLRRSIEKEKGKDSQLLSMFEPPCYNSGQCAEGVRYCGRDLKLRKAGDYFPERRV